MLPFFVKCCLLTQKCKSEDGRMFENNKKGEQKRIRRKSEATVIVNIVIVIGSNNHILISCVCLWFSIPTLTLRFTKQNGECFQVRLECLPYNQCVCECTISKKIRNSDRSRSKTTIPISYGRCRPVHKGR